MSLTLACKNEARQNATKNTPNEKQVKKPRTGQAFVKDDEARPTVLHIAIGSEDHSTLVAAFKSAELEKE
ncbi:MAG: hypothetical protein VW080_08455 [Flavobacteriaceae bacterium]